MTSNIPQAILKQARKSGTLNLCNRSLKDVPSVVWNLNRPPPDDQEASSFDAKDNWWDQVQLTRLNLSSNEIELIPEDLRNFPALISLDIHDNKLFTYPSAILDLKQLKRLDLSHNCLTLVPPLQSCKSVVVLLLQYNQLKELHISEDAMPMCETLDVSHNSISSLPQTLENLVNLRSLNASFNQLVSFPSISGIHSLTMLNLDNNKLKFLSDGIGKLPNLQQLHVRNNVLQCLPPLKNSPNLKEIYAGNNALTEIPEELPDNIMLLELRDNKISVVSVNITRFSRLERFDIANNNISKLPPEIGNMGGIKALVLDGNPIRSIRRDVISQGTQAILKHLKSRIVIAEGAANQKSQVSALPQSEVSSEITRKHAIVTKCKVNFHNGSLETVDAGLDEAVEIPLLVISATHCRLSDVPSKVFLFGNSLTELNISSNKITNIPASVVMLKVLTHFNASSNCLSSLPAELGSLLNLMEVNISNNRFTELPSCLSELVNLQHLLADSNQITKLNTSHLKALCKLQTLSLMNNNIGQVPPEIALIETLQSLKLEGNLFRVPRQSIVQKGSAAVIEYLRSRIPQSIK